MMSNEEMKIFRELFSKYCKREINKGHCEADCCDICPVSNAYGEIFNRFADEEEDEEDNASEYGYVDSLGGYHEGGCGWDPDGEPCGECSTGDCAKCGVWERMKGRFDKED